MTIERDDDSVIGRVYARSSAVLGEKPGAQVRADVIAAAARAVEARPRGSPRSRSPFATGRWPWSAAALLVVSLMTGLVATHVMRTDPDRIVATTATMATRSPQAAAPVSQPAIDSATKPGPLQESRSASPASAAVRADGVRRASRAPRTRIDAADRVAVSRYEDASSTTSDRREPPPQPEPASKATTVATPPPQSDPSAPTQASEPADRPDERVPRPASSSPVTAQGFAGVVQRRRAEPVATPDAWVERIVRMRSEGDDLDADRELEALRRRYPDFVIPRAALRLGQPP